MTERYCGHCLRRDHAHAGDQCLFGPTKFKNIEKCKECNEYGEFSGHNGDSFMCSCPYARVREDDNRYAWDRLNKGSYAKEK